MAYNYSRAITVDYTKVGGTTLTDFPILVSLTNADFKTIANGGHVQDANGYDIVFFSDITLTTKLKYEVERYTATTGELVAWVKIPTLSGSANTVIYVAYGNGAISSFQGDVTGTWNSNYYAVYHVPNGTVLTALDSTSFARNGAVTAATAGTGQVGGDAVFNGTTALINAGNNVLSGATEYSFECWVKTTAAAIQSIFRQDWLYARMMADGSVQWQIKSDFSGALTTGSHVVDGGSFHHVFCVASASTQSIYIDGALATSTARAPSAADTAAPFYFGNSYGSADWWSGSLDEIRFSNTARTVGWVTATYNTAKTPSTFFALGVETSSSAPPQLTSAVLEMALGGSFRGLCCEHEPTAWYRFAETNSDPALHDYSDSGGYHGVVVGGVTQENDPTVPDGGFSYLFDGSTGYVTFASLPATGTTITFECVIKPNTPSTAGTILSNAAGTAYFGLDSARKLNMFYSGASHLSSSALTDLAWSHVMVVITAGSGTFYINGVAAGTFSTFLSFTPTRMGRYDTANYLKAYVDEFAMYPTAFTSGMVTEHYLATLWTDVSADLCGDEPMTLRWGISGNGPTDRIASPGPATFCLLNGTSNSAHLLGYYSPLHANCRTGFTHGVLTRVSFAYNATTYRRYYGKITSIDPIPGRYKERQTRVVCGDLQEDIVNTELRNVTLQTSKTEAQLQTTLLQALPVTAQPVAIDLDTGLDTSPYAFDKLGAGVAAIRPIGDLIISTIGFQSISPTGVYRYENRQSRQLKASGVTFADDMVELIVPSSLDNVFNHIRATFHPKTIDAAATTVLWSQTGTAPSIAAGETVEVWGDYYIPGDQKVKIGGTAQVAPVATTDYLANTLADGSGTNKTANVTVVATPFASSVKFAITNNDASAVFITFLQIRGKGLYDYSPITVEAMSTQGYGDRPVNIDMPFQSSYNTAQGLADYLLAQFDSITNQVQSVKFSAQRSTAFMLSALTAQIGDRISVSETVTGLNSDAFIQGIELEVIPSRAGPRLYCQYDMAIATYFDSVWLLEDAVYGELGVTTVLAFA